jgi:hypothetical protein
MGIDGIGKPRPTGGTVASPGAAGAGAAPPAAQVDQAPFNARAAQTHAASSADGPQSPLEQLKAGAIDLGQYLDIKVQEATASIADLAPAQVDRVRTALRERLSSDPTLVDLVRKATGAIEVPGPSIEE